MTTRQEQSIVGGAVAVGFEIERLVSEGWEIDPSKPLTMLAFGQLECGFIRDATDEQLEADAKPKLTRAEILAKARAAKAAKREEEKESEAND